MEWRWSEWASEWVKYEEFYRSTVTLGYSQHERFLSLVLNFASSYIFVFFFRQFLMCCLCPSRRCVPELQELYSSATKKHALNSHSLFFLFLSFALCLFHMENRNIHEKLNVEQGINCRNALAQEEASYRDLRIVHCAASYHVFSHYMFQFLFLISTHLSVKIKNDIKIHFGFFAWNVKLQCVQFLNLGMAFARFTLVANVVGFKLDIDIEWKV